MINICMALSRLATAGAKGKNDQVLAKELSKMLWHASPSGRAATLYTQFLLSSKKEKNLSDEEWIGEAAPETSGQKG